MLGNSATTLSFRSRAWNFIVTVSPSPKPFDFACVSAIATVPGPSAAKEPATVGIENAIPNALGSTPTVQALPPPLSSGKALRSSVTPETPSMRRTSSATSVENGWPTTLEMMNCEVSDF